MNASLLIGVLQAIIGILSVLTTVLIGMQLYNTFKIKEIKNETLKAKDEILSITNQRLLFTTVGLADFYEIRYIDCPPDVSFDEKGVLFYSTLLYRAVSIEISSAIGDLNCFEKAVKNLTVFLNHDDFTISNDSLDEIIRILETIPHNKRNEGLNQIIDQLKKRVLLMH